MTHIINIHTFYEYNPLPGILITAAIVFAIQTCILLYQFQKSRTIFLLWIIVFTVGECGGYIAYSIFVYIPSVALFLAELITLILAPNLVCLVNYTVVSRIIPFCGFNKESYITQYG